MMRIRNILKNLGLLASGYAYSLVRGRAVGVRQEVRSVLVVQTAKMGDMVCATPVFHALKERFPEARVTVLGDSVGEQVVADNPDVDGYLVARTGFFSLVRSIRRAHFDASVVLVPDARSAALAYLGGVPLVVAPEVVGGYCPWMTKTYRLLVRLVKAVPHRMGYYAPGEYVKMLEPLGIHAEDTTKRLGYSDEARKNAGAFLRVHSLEERKFAIISPSAGNKIKNWPADRFARIAEYLVGKGMPVVVIGGPRDAEEVGAMLMALEKPEGVINALGAFSIDELKAFIAQAALFVAVDTGPIYIAEAFDVPTVDIVGPMDEREQPPIGEKHLVIVPEREQPMLHIMNARMYDAREARRQTEAITVQEVIRAVDTLLQRYGHDV